MPALQVDLSNQVKHCPDKYGLGKYSDEKLVSHSVTSIVSQRALRLSRDNPMLVSQNLLLKRSPICADVK